eukprot:9498985-Pyramimonas_sp.AAC.1
MRCAGQREPQIVRCKAKSDIGQKNILQEHGPSAGQNKRTSKGTLPRVHKNIQQTGRTRG